jgi:hypothetical protein
MWHKYHRLILLQVEFNQLLKFLNRNFNYKKISMMTMKMIILNQKELLLSDFLRVWTKCKDP